MCTSRVVICTRKTKSNREVCEARHVPLFVLLRSCAYSDPGVCVSVSLTTDKGICVLAVPFVIKVPASLFCREIVRSILGQSQQLVSELRCGGFAVKLRHGGVRGFFVAVKLRHRQRKIEEEDHVKFKCKRC